jgi:hypothetical protein
MLTSSGLPKLTELVSFGTAPPATKVRQWELAGGRRDGSALAVGPGCDLPLFAVTLRCAFNRGNPLFGATTPAHVHVLKAS